MSLWVVVDDRLDAMQVFPSRADWLRPETRSSGTDSGQRAVWSRGHTSADGPLGIQMRRRVNRSDTLRRQLCPVRHNRSPIGSYLAPDSLRVLDEVLRCEHSDAYHTPMRGCTGDRERRSSWLFVASRTIRPTRPTRGCITTIETAQTGSRSSPGTGPQAQAIYPVVEAVNDWTETGRRLRHPASHAPAE